MGEIQAETGFGKFEFTHAIEIRSHQCHPPTPKYLVCWDHLWLRLSVFTVFHWVLNWEFLLPSSSFLLLRWGLGVLKFLIFPLPLTFCF